ncbi:hypothetical protein DM860_016891 [Cuscuta australis]|uniref:Plastocyanin-like domain-containing protein n=1 Tax=Cuscuta australis TaxID=267555 RepID=A0A328DXG2_9ASTE|nr:hypothetical protein DM860_016891 [Cuscuta australis]
MGQNFTYRLHPKDQIGSFFYFPSLGFQKAAGGFGGIRILGRPNIPLPFTPPCPQDDYTVLIGDWYISNHTDLKNKVENGNALGTPDVVLINGLYAGPNDTHAWNMTVEQGRTYRLRISNVGLQNTVNFRVQNHVMRLVEVEGTHTQQVDLRSIDVHVGQSYSVLFTADQPAMDYYFVVYTPFTTKKGLVTTAVLHYADQSARPVFRDFRRSGHLKWSRDQATSIKTNLTACGARLSEQGSYNYGKKNISRTITLANSVVPTCGKLRFAVNGVSFVDPETPLLLADHFRIPGVYAPGSMPAAPPKTTAGSGEFRTETAVMGASFREFVEVVLQNNEKTLQTFHINGHNFFVVGMGWGGWNCANRTAYNLKDAVARVTTQVYPKSWTAIYVALDGVGIWNVRSEHWERKYLGQQFYLKVASNSSEIYDKIPKNTLLCGKAAAAAGASTPPPSA